MNITNLILKGTKPKESSFSSAFEQSKTTWDSVKASQTQEANMEHTNNIDDVVDENNSDHLTPDDERRTIFVGNLPTTLGNKGLKKALKALFGKYGTIESLRFRGVGIADPKLSKKVNFVQQNFHEKRDTLIAYVKFKSEHSVEEALKENNTILKSTDSDADGNAKVVSKHIRVDRASMSINNEKSVFIGNLPYGVTEEEVRNHFSSCGNIQSVRIVRDANTGMGKGFGFVTFEDAGSTFLALELNETQLGNTSRNIRISLCESKSKMQGKRKLENTQASNKKQKTGRNPNNISSGKKTDATPTWSGKQAKEGELSTKAIKRKVKKKKQKKIQS